MEQVKGGLWLPTLPQDKATRQKPIWSKRKKSSFHPLPQFITHKTVENVGLDPSCWIFLILIFLNGANVCNHMLVWWVFVFLLWRLVMVCPAPIHLMGRFEFIMPESCNLCKRTPNLWLTHYSLLCSPS